MIVRVSGLVWLPKSDLTNQQLINIKNMLTIIPRRTTDISAKADPEPIFMFEETETELGVPREWYLKNVTKAHEEILDVSYGTPMIEMETRYKAEGHFADQENALRVFSNKMEGKKWCGFMLRAGCGWGKGLAHGEPVLSTSGYVNIETLKVGDLVAGTDGKFHSVTGVYPRGIQDLYSVTFTDETKVVCDSSHLWTFVMRRKGGYSRTIEMSDLYNRKLSNNAGKKFWLPTISPVEFDSRYDLLLDPYTLGVILGDGCIAGTSVILSLGDLDILDNLSLLEGESLSIVKDKRDECWDVRFKTKWCTNGSSYDCIKYYGLSGKKSFDKFIPIEYIYSSVVDRISILQGLFDTDGHAISSGMVEYSTTSGLLAQSVKDIVYSLGGTCVVSGRETMYTEKDGSRSKPFKSFRLRVKLPLNIEPFRISRKLSVFKKAVWQRSIGRAVLKIEYIGKGESTCISVDSPDHLFLTRNCIPTHNTAFSLEFARRTGLSTLILVHKEFFVEQWRNAIKFFMPEARIGIIQQNKCDYKNKDFVIGMIQSLSRDSGEKYPDEMYRSMGTLISDEVHRVSSQTWNSVIYAFNAAYRIGLSATPRRKDGTESVFFNHISDITYSATVDSQVPLLRVVKTDTELKPIRRGTYFVAVKDLNSAQLISQLVSDTMRTRDIVDQVLLAAKNGRKVMVVSERLEHLKEMSELFDASVKASNIPFEVTYDFYTGEWFTGEVWHERTKTHKKGELKKKKRSSEDLYKAESANVIFATKQCTEEGLDIPAIDVLVLTTPLGDPEQTVGRVRRWCTPREDKCKHLCPWRAGVCKEKPTPVVTDVVDVKIQKLYGKWLRRKKFYEQIGTIKKTGKI